MRAHRGEHLFAPMSEGQRGFWNGIATVHEPRMTHALSRPLPKGRGEIREGSLHKGRGNSSGFSSALLYGIIAV